MPKWIPAVSLVLCSWMVSCGPKQGGSSAPSAAPQATPTPVKVDSVASGQTGADQIAELKKEADKLKEAAAKRPSTEVAQPNQPVSNPPVVAKKPDTQEPEAKEPEPDAIDLLRRELSEKGIEASREVLSENPSVGMLFRHILKDTLLNRGKNPVEIDVLDGTSDQLAFVHVSFDGKARLLVYKNALEESFVAQAMNADMVSPLRFTNRLYARIIEILADESAMIALVEKQFGIEIGSKSLTNAQILSLYRVMLDLPPGLVKAAQIKKMIVYKKEDTTQEMGWTGAIYESAKQALLIQPREWGLSETDWTGIWCSAFVANMPRPFWTDLARLSENQFDGQWAQASLARTMAGYLSNSEKLKKDNPKVYAFLKEKVFGNADYLQEVAARAKIFVPSIQEDVTPPVLVDGKLEQLLTIQQSGSLTGTRTIHFSIKGSAIQETGSGVATVSTTIFSPIGAQYLLLETAVLKKGWGGSYSGSIQYDATKVPKEVQIGLRLDMVDRAGNPSSVFGDITIQGSAQSAPVVPAPVADTRPTPIDPGLASSFNQIQIRPYSTGRLGRGKLSYQVILPLLKGRLPDQLRLHWSASQPSRDLVRSGQRDQNFSYWFRSPGSGVSDAAMNFVSDGVNWLLNDHDPRYSIDKNHVVLDVIFPEHLVSSVVTLNEVQLYYNETKTEQGGNFEIVPGEGQFPVRAELAPAEQSRFRIVDSQLSLKLQEWDKDHSKNPVGGEKTVWMQVPLMGIKANEISSVKYRLRDPITRTHDVEVTRGWAFGSWAPAFNQVKFEEDAKGLLWMRLPIHLLTHNLQGDYSIEGVTIEKAGSTSSHYYGQGTSISETAGVNFLKRNQIKSIRVE